MSLIQKDFKVTKQHGQFIEKNGVLMMGTFHPAALLRNPVSKPAAMEDLLGLAAKAKELGSDYIVVGRPVTQAEDPVAAYRRCVEEFVG